MPSILGIPAFYHRSVAYLLCGGEIVATQEAPFTRVRSEATFPDRAVEYCLRTGSRSPTRQVPGRATFWATRRGGRLRRSHASMPNTRMTYAEAHTGG